MSDQPRESHPYIRFRPEWYSGKDRRRLDAAQKEQRLAAKLQRFVDEAWARNEAGIYTTHEIMEACSIDIYDQKVVELLMMGAVGSSSALTIKPR